VLVQLNQFSLMAQGKALPTLAATPWMVWTGETVLQVRENDGPVTKAMKNAMLKAWSAKMACFVDVAESNGKLERVANGIKAALLDPRFSKIVQDRIGQVKLSLVQQNIITDTLFLVPEELEDLVEHQLESGLDAVLKMMSKLPYPEKIDPLQWWRDLSCGNYAQFYSAVFLSPRLYLSMPAGSSPSECVFSQTTDIVTKKRNSLGDGTLEKIVVIRSFLKSKCFDFETLIKQLAEDARKREKQAELMNID